MIRRGNSWSHCPSTDRISKRSDRFGRQMRIRGARCRHCIKALTTCDVDDVKMDAGNPREIGRRLNGQSLRVGRVRRFPVSQRARRLVALEVLPSAQSTLRSRNARRL